MKRPQHSLLYASRSADPLMSKNTTKYHLYQFSKHGVCIKLSSSNYFRWETYKRGL